MSSLILRQVARAVFPAALVFAVHLLLRGHDRPGGGFIAGLVVTTTIVLEALAHGAAEAERRYARFLRPATWIGLAVALASGLLPALRGEPVFTFPHTTLDLGSRDLELSMTLIFDVGVFLVIVGATATALAIFLRPGAGEVGP